MKWTIARGIARVIKMNKKKVKKGWNFLFKIYFSEKLSFA